MTVRDNFELFDRCLTRDMEPLLDAVQSFELRHKIIDELASAHMDKAVEMTNVIDAIDEMQL
jgi:hypothetical protein